MLKKIYNFIKYNEHKKLTILTYIYARKYKNQVWSLEAKQFETLWGKYKEQSPPVDTVENYRYARELSYCVNQVCGKTKDKCLVRALTAQKLMSKKKIKTTLYLGCKPDENGKIDAHAWLRCGEVYVTGGNGEGYAVVAYFLK